MVTLVIVIAAATLAAVPLALAYWGLLILCQPSLDRLRLVAHGRRGAWQRPGRSHDRAYRSVVYRVHPLYRALWFVRFGE